MFRAAVAKNRVQPQKEVVAVSVGDKVNHTSFGNGTVLAVEGAGDKTVAKVKFDVGEKRPAAALRAADQAGRLAGP